jgi:hypothetical protein
MGQGPSVVRNWLRAVLAATASVVAAASVVACGGQEAAADQKAVARSSTQTGGPPFPPTASKLAELRELAYSTSAGMGVEEPSDARVFATTFGTANIALRGVASAPARIGEPIYLVTMRGGVFVAEDVPRPPSAPAPTGRMVALFVDPESDMVKAALLSDHIRDLSALGESLPLDD